MWMLPYFPAVSRAASHAYYRLTVSGHRVPASGPTLIVANHPNGLLDPVLVVEAAQRNIRFLAKATLFKDPAIGWLVRASGSIPVHRKEDDPDLMEYNRETFRCVRAELASGAAVGVFPEGTSHSRPNLGSLKTGAARLALSTAAEMGHSFPLVPVGLVPQCKTSFRSEMLVVIGEEIDWSDLAGRSDEDRDAVHELTTRIDTALRGVTVNLHQWEDRPLVEAAEEIWTMHTTGDPAPSARVRRLRTATRMLAEVRADGCDEEHRLHEALRRHVQNLGELGLTPADLVADAPRPRWLLRCARLLLFGTLSLVPFAVTRVVFFIPWWATRGLAGAFEVGEDRIATYKILAGILLYVGWTLGLAVLVGVWTHWAFGILTGVLLIPAAAWGNAVQERWRIEARRLLRRSRVRRMHATLDRLRAEQTRLGQRLAALLDARSATTGVAEL